MTPAKAAEMLGRVIDNDEAIEAQDRVKQAQMVEIEADPDFPDDIDPADRAFWADKETIPVEPGQATLI